MSQTIKVNKARIVERIRANRDTHRAIYEKAIEGYRQEAVKRLNQVIDQLKAGELPSIQVRLPLPEDHTRDYDAVLSMLDAHVDKTIPITESDYRAYVLDEWDWKDRWVTTNVAYAEYMEG